MEVFFFSQLSSSSATIANTTFFFCKSRRASPIGCGRTKRPISPLAILTMQVHETTFPAQTSLVHHDQLVSQLHPNALHSAHYDRRRSAFDAVYLLRRSSKRMHTNHALRIKAWARDIWGVRGKLARISILFLSLLRCTQSTSNHKLQKIHAELYLFCCALAWPSSARYFWGFSIVQGLG